MDEVAPQTSLEDLRFVLEQARNHIQDKWCEGSWFQQSFIVNGTQVYFDCQTVDGSTLWSPQDLLDLANPDIGVDYATPDITELTRALGDNPTVEAIQAPLIGVCAVGSVLHALGYTDKAESYTEQSQAVITELYNNLPEPLTVNNYSDKMTQVIQFNDEYDKEHVLDLFDRSIKSVIERMA